jgi:hypothetical protein
MPHSIIFGCRIIFLVKAGFFVSGVRYEKAEAENADGGVQNLQRNPGAGAVGGAQVTAPY